MLQTRPRTDWQSFGGGRRADCRSPITPRCQYVFGRTPIIDCGDADCAHFCWRTGLIWKPGSSLRMQIQGKIWPRRSSCARWMGVPMFWAIRVAYDLQVTDINLWLGYVHMLMHMLLMHGGSVQLSAAKVVWVRKGLTPLTPAGTALLTHGVDSLSADCRSRGPWLVSLYARLQQEATVDDNHATSRLTVLWFHLVAITYYVGSTDFVETILLQDGWLRGLTSGICSSLWQAMLTFVQHDIPYTDRLLHRLRLYALSRRALRRWFERKDGSRIPWRVAEECEVWAHDQRYFDALIHVNSIDGWFDVCWGIADSFEALREAIRANVSRMALFHAGVTFMRAILALPLLGRPSYAANAKFDLRLGAHCYWSKFPQSAGHMLLGTLEPSGPHRTWHFLRELEKPSLSCNLGCLKTCNDARGRWRRGALPKRLEV